MQKLEKVENRREARLPQPTKSTEQQQNSEERKEQSYPHLPPRHTSLVKTDDEDSNDDARCFVCDTFSLMTSMVKYGFGDQSVESSAIRR